MTPHRTDASAFASLELPSFIPVPTTPHLAEHERGLRIAAPAEVVISDDMRVPVSAIASFDAEIWNALPSRFWAHAAVVITDQSGRTFAPHSLADKTPLKGDKGPLPLPPPSSPSGPAPAVRENDTNDMSDVPFPDDPSGDSSIMETIDDVPTVQAESAISYYNFDVLTVIELPRQDGSEYVMYLEYDRIRSNSVRVRLVANSADR